MTSGVKALGGTLTHAAAGGLKIFTAGVGAAATGLSTLGVAAIKVGSSFEAEMSKVSAISGASADDFKALSEKAKEMGASTKFSATESAQAMEYMAMAGWKTEDMLSGIEGIMNLAAASGEDLATTSDIVTDALTAFGLSASDSTHFADVLAAASSNANTNVSMMGETFKYVAPVAGALGFSAEDCAVAVGLMANSGIKASQSGTTLRSIFSRMVSPTDTVAAAMDALNISITDNDGSMKSLNEIMLDLREGFSGLSEAEKSQMAAAIGGQEAMSGLLAIVNASDSDFDKLQSAIYNCDGAAAQMAETMQDNLQGSITILKSALEGLGIEVYESMEPTLSGAVEIANGYIDELTKAFQDGGAEGLAGALGTVLADLVTRAAEYAPQMVQLAVQLLNALAQGIIDNLPELMDAAHEIADAILDGIGDLCPAIEPVTDAIQTLIDNFDDLIPIVESAIIVFVGLKAGMAIQSAVQGFQKAKVTLALFKMQAEGASIAQAALNGTLSIGEAVVALLTGKMSLAELATAGLTKAHGALNAVMAANPITLVVLAIAALVAIFVVLWNKCDWFREFWINLWESVKETASNVIDAIVGFFAETIPNALENLKTFVTDNWEALLMLLNPATALAGIFKLLYDNCDSFRAWVDQAWNSIVSFFTEQIPAFFQNIIDSIAEWGENAKETIVTAVTEMIENVLTFFSELPEKLAYWLGYAIGSLIKFGQDAVKWAVESVPLIIENITTFFSELPGKIWKHLQKAISNISKWKDNTIQKAAEAGEKFISNVVTFFSELPEKIRSRLHEAIDNISKWKKETVEKAKAAGKEFVSNVVTFFSELPGKIWNHLSNVLKKIVTFKKDMTAKAREAAKGFFDKIVDGIKSLPDKMQEIGSNIVQGVWKGISAGWDWLVSSVQNLANSLFQGVKDALGIHSPSRKFKWIGEMCVAGLDEPLAEYNPYDTALKSLKVNEGTLASSFAVTAKNSYGVGAVSHSDYRKMADAMTTAFERVGFKVEIGRRDFGRLVCEVS